MEAIWTHSSENPSSDLLSPFKWLISMYGPSWAEKKVLLSNLCQELLAPSRVGVRQQSAE